MTAPTRRITVLGTGGTVAARSDAAGVLAPATVPADLLSGVPVPGHVAVSAREVMAVDSAALSLDDMGRIADAAADALAGGADGVVVLHGTDTLTESALVADLHPALRTDPRPVLYTGAQRPADHPRPDGPANLATALAAAAADTPCPGAAVVFAGQTLPVWGAAKVHTTDPDGFAAAGAAADPVTAGLAATRDRALAAMTGRTPGPWPRVDAVLLYPGVDAAAIVAARRAGARAIVLAAMGAGNANPAIARAVAEATAAGVPIVVCTEVAHGPAFADYGGGGGGADLVAAGAVISPWLRTQQTRVLLAALLAHGLGRDAIARVLTEP